ncbi:MAG: DUF2332 family protein [Devosia sp.]
MAQTDLVLKQLADQAGACDQLGSPFTARLCRLLAKYLDKRTRFGTRILEWDGDPAADNVALRACGAIHALARSGWEPNVTAVYPPTSVPDSTLWAAIADALHHNDAFLTDRLSSAPQTNEVARSALILGAMLHLAAATKLPLDLFEIGASAGLNLGFDRYRYTLDEGRVWGPLDAPLAIDCPWRGSPPPLDAPLSVVGRQGCDLNPLDSNSPEDRARLLSYIWADQTHRLQRIDAALKLAAADRRPIDRADAADWLEQKFATPLQAGRTRVLIHTIVWPYVPARSKARIEAVLAEIGARATADRPVARLSIEPDETPGSARIDLTIWPAGRTITLGRGDYHGRWAEWAKLK